MTRRMPEEIRALQAEVDRLKSSLGEPTTPRDPDWLERLERNKEGRLVRSYANTVEALRQIYGARLSYDEMALQICLDGKAMGDADVGRVREHLGSLLRLHPSLSDTVEALRQIASERSCHPVRAYLEGLTWDGVERIDYMADDLLGAEREALTIRMLRAWMISCVARAMDPGCQVDTALVLVGPQGMKKSTFFRVLAGGFFADTEMKIGDKDALLQLHAAWIYEWSEIDRITSSRHAGQIKGFVTSPVDAIRPPFARAVVKHPRSGVIVGSTNMEQFLTDETGSRRFWIVRVTRTIDRAVVEAQRDQLWAEAVHLYRASLDERGRPADFTWWLTPEEDAEREVRAEQHAREDAWQDQIAQYLGGQAVAGLLLSRRTAEEAGYVTTGDVLGGALKLDAADWGTAEQTRVGLVMRRLGWRKERPRLDGRRVWVFRPPAVAPNGGAST